MILPFQASDSKKTEILKKACLGNEDAFNFLMTISKICRLWDDVWDQDKTHSKEDFDECFSKLSFDLSRNTFFKRHRDMLEAQIFVAWNAWSDANQWDKSENVKKKACSFFIRDYCNELIPLCAWLVGGREHARKISPEAREIFLKEQ